MKIAIVTAATCFLGFCLGGGDNQETLVPAPAPPSYQALQNTTLYKSGFQPTGQIGSYLSANFAQRRFDWDNAYNYMETALEEGGPVTEDNEHIYRRAMLVAVSAGEYKEAFALADKLSEYESAESLTMIVKSIQAMKNGDKENVHKQISAMPDDGLSRFMRPILTGWLDAEDGKLNTEALKRLSLFHTQAILMAAYLDKDEEMERALADAMLAQDLKILDIETIADGFTHIGQYERAQQLYEQILKVTPDYETVQDKFAAIEAGEKPDYLDTVSDPQAGVARAFYDLARLLFHQGNDETAQFVVQLSNALEPDRTENTILLGSLAANNGRIEDALSYYSAVPEGDEQYLPIRREIADLLEEAERHHEAIAILEELAHKYGDIKSLIKIGDIYRRDQKFDEAVNAYNRAESAIGGTDIPEEYWHLHYVRGMAYEQAGQWDKAQDDLQAALAQRPENPFVLNYLGYAWADQGTNIEKAKEMIEKAVALEPTDGYITDSLGWVLYRMGEYKEAVKYLERAVALLPYDPVINDHLGDAYWQAGRRIEARFQWERARNHAEADDAKLLSFIDEKLENGLSRSLVIKQAGANYDNTPDTDLQTP